MKKSCIPDLNLCDAGSVAESQIYFFKNENGVGEVNRKEIIAFLQIIVAF